MPRAIAAPTDMALRYVAPSTAAVMPPTRYSAAATTAGPGGSPSPNWSS
jgi:hypothetical protein